MPDYEPIDYRLRCHSKRTDLSPDVLRDICEAYETIQRLTKERDEARRIACNNAANYNSMMFDNPKYSDPRAIAESHSWDCFKEDGK
jgi:hypothetical protein